MDAYIEIESLRSLISQRNDERYDDCKRLLKRNLYLHFPFTKEEAFADPLIQRWVAELTTGRSSRKPEWNCNYPDPECELSQDGMSLEQICAVYLLDDKAPQPLSNAMLVGCYGQELDTLAGLYVVPEKAELLYPFSVSQMKSWNVVKPYVTPCTDLLIVDRYILSKAFLLERNLYRLIKIFVSKTKSVKINIVIVVESGSIDSISLDDISDKIKTFVEDIVGEEPFITFILCKKLNRLPNDKEVHDRCIITNYRHLDPGDSFNYFDERGELRTGGFKLSIYSLAINDDYLQRIIDSEILSKIRNEMKTARIIGDKKSNFLIFP